MSKLITGIEISFPTAIELPRGFQHRLHVELVSPRVILARIRDGLERQAAAATPPATQERLL